VWLTYRCLLVWHGSVRRRKNYHALILPSCHEQCSGRWLRAMSHSLRHRRSRSPRQLLGVPSGHRSVSIVFITLTSKMSDQIPRDCPPAIASLIQRCWAESPDARPDFAAIVDELTDIVTKFSANEPAGGVEADLAQDSASSRRRARRRRNSRVGLDEPADQDRQVELSQRLLSPPPE